MNTQEMVAWLRDKRNHWMSVRCYEDARAAQSLIERLAELQSTVDRYARGELTGENVDDDEIPWPKPEVVGRLTMKPTPAWTREPPTVGTWWYWDQHRPIPEYCVIQMRDCRLVWVEDEYTIDEFVHHVENMSGWWAPVETPEPPQVEELPSDELLDGEDWMY